MARHRLRVGLTQEKFAELLSLSTRYIQGLEAGDYFPALPNLVLLRGILGITWNQLFQGCEPELPDEAGIIRKPNRR